MSIRGRLRRDHFRSGVKMLGCEDLSCVYCGKIAMDVRRYDRRIGDDVRIACRRYEQRNRREKNKKKQACIHSTYCSHCDGFHISAMGSLPTDLKSEEMSITMLNIEKDLDRIGLWRSTYSKIQIPELGIESVSAGSRPGLFATFSSLGDLIRKIYYDLCVKQNLGQGERSKYIRESLQRLVKGEMSASLIVSDPCRFLFEEEEEDKEEKEDDRVTNSTSTDDFDADVIQDEEQASILASFINLVNQDATEEQDVKSGTQISVLWPPDGKYYSAVVLPHEHNANLPGIAVLYTETNEIEQGVQFFRIKQ